MKARHGLTMRLALSCLVDADHADTARFETGRALLPPLVPRWSDRLARLDSYVAGLPGRGDELRSRNRARFYDLCRNADAVDPMLACEGPVGIGKTTAVTAHLLRSAHELKLRRLFVVAPYTNIITQTANTLRQALTLHGEDGRDVVAEHHHRADFSRFGDRDLALLWRAPVVVTTAVQLFETLASNHPGQLRKLHELPGSAIFIDEAHAALPAHLWPQNWLWLKELAEKWRCKLVFASGSLARFWEKPKIVAEPRTLKEMSEPMASALTHAESRRVRHRTLNNVGGLEKLVARVLAENRGPRLLILNTVQSAAVVARAMKVKGADVLHVSTALCPRDRDLILEKVKRRLDAKETDWTLVATSCVEAGVDLSFRSAFRERFSAANLIQTGGRVNRHGEYDSEGGGIVYDFLVERGDGITLHPKAQVPGEVLKQQFRDGVFDNDASPADVVTSAMEEELKGRFNRNALVEAEKKRDYPACAAEGRVIDADTRLVVIDKSLQERLERREHVGTRDLLAGSVQIWATKIAKLDLTPVRGRDDVYAWPYGYDPDFLGYMSGLLDRREVLDKFNTAGGAII